MSWRALLAFRPKILILSFTTVTTVTNDITTKQEVGMTSQRSFHLFDIEDEAFRPQLRVLKAGNNRKQGPLSLSTD